MAADTALVAERRFRAMGTDAHVLVNRPDADDAADVAVARVVDLERRWSRFLPDSEVSRLNERPGEACVVSGDTFTLIEKAVFAWQVTGGAYDPTMLRPLESIGYDVTFESIDESIDGAVITSSACAASTERPVSAGDIDVDRASGTVRLPVRGSFDPGGIGKGLAADIVSGELIADGAWGALVNLGGDLRVRGLPPHGLEWVVSVHEPTVFDEPLARLRLQDGAVATSTTRRRRWGSGDEELHHLLDPQTARPHTDGADLVTVVGGEAWWAEVCATALIGPRPVDLPSCSAMRILADGTREYVGSFEEHTF